MAVQVESSDFKGPFAHLDAAVQVLPLSVWDIAVGALMSLRGGKPRSVEAALASCGLALEMLTHLENADHPGFLGRFFHDGRVCTSESFAQLEESEKAAVSFRVGSGLADCIAQSLLGTSHLVHVRPLIDRGVIELASKRKSRPDFIGRDVEGRWHVVEAKGRQRPTVLTMSNAKRQARAVRVVRWPDGQSWPPAGLIDIGKCVPTTPITRCASVARLLGRPVVVRLRDPENAKRPRRTYIVHENTFLDSYFDLVRVASATSPVDERLIGSWIFVGGGLANTPVWVGAEQRLYDRLVETNLTAGAYAEFQADWAPSWASYQVGLQQSEAFQRFELEPSPTSVRLSGLAVALDLSIAA